MKRKNCYDGKDRTLDVVHKRAPAAYAAGTAIAILVFLPYFNSVKKNIFPSGLICKTICLLPLLSSTK